jgi:dCMP deaminase
MPDEDVSRAVAQKYFSSLSVEFVSVFLRWDRDAVVKEENASLHAHRSSTVSELERVFMERAEEEARKSADWWRQVGAVLVQDKQVIFAARNDHVPSPQAPYAFGDPRSVFKRGVRIECSTAEHAEAALIAEAAKRGVTTQGASLYTTMFPCPQCARLIAHAGIKRCYFANGYAVLDGASVMTEQGVELIFIDNETPRN